MCEIYSGAYVTLAAAWAADSDVGLFRESASFKMTPELPLLSRAWVYQERLLSPRIVYFTRYEAAFECAGSNRDKICEKYWHQIVGEYSGLRISFTSDRLPALAGVARQYGTAHSADLGRYVAGMWENCFPSELLWYCASRRVHHRPDSYCGPTWSWISTGNTASYATGCPRVYPDDLEILGINFNLDGPDKYASISEATMDVTGYLAPGTLVEVHNVLDIFHLEARSIV
ncbi:hypothetical protein TrVGV298_005499 [Trichoderma virens]|nr:hypothetical protein TrVGV298_005499 [Trichoderma virens]